MADPEPRRRPEAVAVRRWPRHLGAANVDKRRGLVIDGAGWHGWDPGRSNPARQHRDPTVSGNVTRVLHSWGRVTERLGFYPPAPTMPRRSPDSIARSTPRPPEQTRFRQTTSLRWRPHPRRWMRSRLRPTWGVEKVPNCGPQNISSAVVVRFAYEVEQRGLRCRCGVVDALSRDNLLRGSRHNQHEPGVVNRQVIDHHRSLVPVGHAQLQHRGVAKCPRM